MDYKRLVHNTVRIGNAGLVIYADPYCVPRTERADLIFVTHEHYDHFSPKDIQKLIGAETVLIAPSPVAEAAKEAGLACAVYPVRAGESGEARGVRFEAVPAYNERKKFHPRSAGGVGFVLTVAGTRFYIAGDTDATREVKQVRCDVAFVPVGGTYTMDAREAAEAVNAIRPAVAVPTHYGALPSVAGVEAAQRFEALLADGIECRIF